MNGRYKTVFRSLVLGQWALTLVSLGGSVPSELQDKANQSYASHPQPFHLFLGIACSLGVLKIVGAIGLFLFKRWARPLFAIAAVAGILTPFLGGVLPAELRGVSEPPLSASLAALLNMMDGAILALAYGPLSRSLFAPSGSVMPSEVDAG